MGYWDGERFIFGDDSAVQPNRPVDTLLENVMRAQQTYLLRHRGNRVGHCRRRTASGLTNYLGDKTYASLQRVNFFSRLMWVCPNAKKLSLFFTARVGCEDPADPVAEVKVWVELEGFGIQEATWVKGPRYQEYELSFVFDEATPPPPRPVLVQMRLWMKSNVYTEGTTNLNFNVRRYPGELQVSGLYPNAGFPGPNANTLHEKYTSVYGAEKVDHLVQLGTDSVIVYPPNPSGGGGSYALGWLSYLQIKGLFYEEEYTPVMPPLSDFRAGIPITGQHVLGHVQRLQEIHTRPRLLDFGHQGERVDLAEIWHYHEDWQYLRSESGSPWRHVLQAPVILDEPGGRLELNMLLLPYQMLESYTQGTSTAKLHEDGAFALWEVKLELRKYTIVGGEDVLLSQTQEVSFTHLPTDASGLWPVLTQLKWREFGFDGPRHPTLKEGLLYEVDQLLIERVLLSFDTSMLTLADIDEPLSLVVEMRQVDAEFRTTEPSLGEDVQYLGLLLTGMTLWSRHG